MGLACRPQKIGPQVPGCRLGVALVRRSCIPACYVDAKLRLCVHQYISYVRWNSWGGLDARDVELFSASGSSASCTQAPRRSCNAAAFDSRQQPKNPTTRFALRHIASRARVRGRRYTLLAAGHATRGSSTGHSTYADSDRGTGTMHNARTCGIQQERWATAGRGGPQGGPQGDPKALGPGGYSPEEEDECHEHADTEAQQVVLELEFGG